MCVQVECFQACGVDKRSEVASSKKGVMKLVCGCECEYIYIRIYYVYTLLQDGRLRKLGNALRGAQMYGFTNGLSKALICRMVDLVIEEGLCDKHQMKMHV